MPHLPRALSHRLRIALLVLFGAALWVPLTAPAAPQDDAEIPWVRGRIALPVAGTVRLALTQPSALPRLKLGASRLYDSLPLDGELWREEFDLLMEMTVPQRVEMAGQSVEPETYVVFTFPTEQVWTFYLIPAGDLMGMPQPDPQTGETVQLFVPSPRVRLIEVTPEPAEVHSLRLLGERRDGGGVDLVVRARQAEVRVSFE